jgi:hypothetical protein
MGAFFVSAIELLLLISAIAITFIGQRTPERAKRKTPGLGIPMVNINPLREDIRVEIGFMWNAWSLQPAIRKAQ